MLRFLTLLFLSITFIGCRQKKTPEQLRQYFYEKKPQLDVLIANLQKDKKLDSLFRIYPDSGLPNIEDQYPYEYSILKNCGITDASSHPNSYPKRTQWYYFRTNWPDSFSIILSCNTRNSYDSSKRLKGYYEKDRYSNEWWGLGDGWQMLRLVKVMDYIKQ